jgi:hypothetical protein
MEREEAGGVMNHVIREEIRAGFFLLASLAMGAMTCAWPHVVRSCGVF